jgi:hypothetical protein
MIALQGELFMSGGTAAKKVELTRTKRHSLFAHRRAKPEDHFL